MELVDRIMEHGATNYERIPSGNHDQHPAKELKDSRAT